MPIDGRQEMLRKLSEQGEKLKAAEARTDEADGLRRMDNAAMLDLNKLKQAAEAERDGLGARLATSTKDCDYFEKQTFNLREKVKALEQRIAGAKVCSHIYTRVALTSTTTCPACTKGIVWPQPAEQTAAPVAEGHKFEPAGLQSINGEQVLTCAYRCVRCGFIVDALESTKEQVNSACPQRSTDAR